MSPKLADLLRLAALLLEEDAQATFRSCDGTLKPWACGDCRGRICNARRSHDERIAAAKQLRAEAGAPPPPPPPPPARIVREGAIPGRSAR